MRRLTRLAGRAMILDRRGSTVNRLVAVKQMFCAIKPSSIAGISFFLLAANPMDPAGSSRGRVEFANSLVGGMKGDLPISCVLTCMIFAAVSNSSVATPFDVGAIRVTAIIKPGNFRSRATVPQATGAEPRRDRCAAGGVFTPTEAAEVAVG